MSDVNADALKIVEKQIDDKLVAFEGKIKGDFDNTEIKKQLTAKDAEILKLNENVAKLSTQLDAVQTTQKNIGTLKAKETFEEQLYSAFTAKEVKEEIDLIVKRGGQQIKPLMVQVNKAAVDMTTALTIGAGSTQNTITHNTGIISAIRGRVEKYFQSVSIGEISSARALWVEEVDEQGAAVFIAEGAGKTQLSVLYVEKTQEVKKIAVYGKVTTEMMADTPQLISYIQNNLLKRVANKTETELLVGAGTGDTLKGAKTFATTFAAGALVLAIDNANEFDALEAAALQVEIANGVPNAAYVHPSTLAKMKLIKDTTNVPLWKAYTDNLTGSIMISGMKLITSTAVTAGEFICGDFKTLNVLFREGLSVQIGLDGNDFTNNKKTILVEQRLVQFASANDTPCLVKGVFSTVKAALETA